MTNQNLSGPISGDARIDMRMRSPLHEQRCPETRSPIAGGKEAMSEVFRRFEVLNEHRCVNGLHGASEIRGRTDTENRTSGRARSPLPGDDDSSALLIA